LQAIYSIDGFQRELISTRYFTSQRYFDTLVSSSKADINQVGINARKTSPPR